MRLRRISPSVFAFAVLWSAVGLTGDGEPDFLSGVGSFRKNDLASARAAFSKSIQADPANPSTLFNLGLVEYRSGNEGLGIGLWRKALVARPDYRPAQEALTWAIPRLPKGTFGVDEDPWEEFRDAILAPVPLDNYLQLTVILILLTGWTTLRYLGTRRRALLDEKDPPGFPTMAAALGTLLFISTVMSALKIYDQGVTRATVLRERVSVQTLPGPESTSLFDLFEGFEVIVRQSRQDWLLVRQPGGLTGWIPKDSVIITSNARVRP